MVVEVIGGAGGGWKSGRKLLKKPPENSQQ